MMNRDKAQLATAPPTPRLAGFGDRSCSERLSVSRGCDDGASRMWELVVGVATVVASPGVTNGTLWSASGDAVAAAVDVGEPSADRRRT